MALNRLLIFFFFLFHAMRWLSKIKKLSLPELCKPTKIIICLKGRYWWPKMEKSSTKMHLAWQTSIWARRRGLFPLWSKIVLWYFPNDARPFSCCCTDCTGAYRRRAQPCSSKSISSFMVGFKSAPTKRINEFRQTPGLKVWQPRFHDRIIRNEQEFQKKFKYIQKNPRNWTEG